MQASDRVKSVLKALEPFSARAFQDDAAVCRIGYGSSKVEGHPVFMGQSLSMTLAEAQLTRDIAEAEGVIAAHIRSELNQQQYDALVLTLLKLGLKEFKNSKLKQIINTNPANNIIAALIRGYARQQLIFGGRLQTIPSLLKYYSAAASLYESEASLIDE